MINSKFVLILSAAALLLSTSSCTTIVKELRHPGGYPGHLLDKRTFNASNSKQLQLFRMAMITALASRVASATVRDGEDADAYIKYLENAVREINYQAGIVYERVGNDGTDDGEICVRNDYKKEYKNCSTYDSLFEANMPDLEYKIGRLVFASLPQREAAKFASKVKSGNVIGSAWGLLRLAGKNIDGFHRGAAVYRTSQEILAIETNNNGGTCAAESKNVENVENVGNVENAVKCLGLSNFELFNNPKETDFKPPAEVSRHAFYALFKIIRRSCNLYPINVEIDNDNSNSDPLKSRYDNCKNLEFKPIIFEKALEKRFEEKDKSNDSLEQEEK